MMESTNGGAGRGDELAGDSDAARRAVVFLRAMERRDLALARSFLAPGFTMCFPGTGEMQQLEQLIERSARRYRGVVKDFERIDVGAAARDGRAAIVYCSGRLRGSWADGRTFAGIRFIDRFELVDGLIRRQDVWNDMGEVAPRA